jgi:dTDP-4-dehydrorhamnose reductase
MTVPATGPATVLVFGRTGQLGHALHQMLEGTPGWRLVGRDDADLSVPGAAARAVAEARPEWVVNAAAYTAVDQAESEPGRAHRINAEATGEMAAAAAEAGAAFLHVSTDYVYDGGKQGPWREDDPTGPLGVYGRTKLEGERLALAANPRTVILRTAWVYAPWGRNFVRTMLRLAAERPRLHIVDDQTGNPTSALDLARACRHTVETLGEAPAGDPRWGLYHYAGGGTVTWAGFAHEIFRLAEARGLIRRAPEIEPITTADYPTPARRPANSALDCARFERAFGLAPRPWGEALAEVMTRIEDSMGAEVAP